MVKDEDTDGNKRRFSLVVLLSPYLMSARNPRCLRCSKHFSTESDVLRHMNNPATACSNWLNDLKRVGTPHTLLNTRHAAPLAAGSVPVDSGAFEESGNLNDGSDEDFPMGDESEEAGEFIEMYKGAAESYGAGRSIVLK